MSWAKSVLPAFTGGSSGKFRIAPNQVQIDTIDFRPQAPAKSALSRTPLAVNRTAVTKNIERIGDHTTNIAESVQYIIEGYTLLSGQRPSATTDRLSIAVEC
jgi:hypothetical protein